MRYKHKFSTWAVLGCFVCSIVIIFPRHFSMDPANLGSTIDAGWIWAFKFFVSHGSNYSWGRDVIYTYGPLGVFSTRYFPEKYAFFQLALDLYLLSCLGLVFHWLRKTGNVTWLYLLSACLVVGMWEISFLLQAVSIILLIIISRNSKAIWLSIPIILTSALLLYIKLNTVILTIPILLTLLFLLVGYRTPRLIVGLVALFIGLNILLVYTFHVSIIDYWRTSIDTVTDYSYAMYFSSPAYQYPLYMGILLSGVVVIITAYMLFTSGRPSFGKLLLSGNVVLLYFILFKEGFTRGDRGHFTQYFCLLPLLLFCLHLILEGRRWLVGLCIIVAGLPVLLGAFIQWKHYPGGTALFSREVPGASYMKELYATFSHNRKPEHQGRSFDYQINQCINGSRNPNTNWHNRPAFQSIIAVSARIDSIDAQYYAGDQAPDTIFYDHTSVDDRNPLWDDPQLKLVIFRQYRFLRMTTSGELVLVRRPIALVEKDSIILDTVVSFDQVINLPGNVGVVAMKAEVNYTWQGRTRAIFYQPPHVGVQLFNEKWVTGSSAVRYISPLHNNQLLIVNYRITSGSNKAFIPLVSRFSIQPNITSLCFRTDMPTGVVNRVRIRLYRISIK